jgi:hypothetical protein
MLLESAGVGRNEVVTVAIEWLRPMPTRPTEREGPDERGEHENTDGNTHAAKIAA